MPCIVVIPPDGEPESHPLTEKVTTVGRTPANQIRISDTAASRKHCLIKASGQETYTLVDLGSANGTVVNGQRVKEHGLTSGDRIQIGKTVLVFKES